jgi:AcrR family transcriptional regulator
MPAGTARVANRAALQAPRPRAQARRSRPESRRADLIEAALGCFAERGVTGTSVDDIVRAAGVAKGTFYLYLDSKDAVVHAVAGRMVEQVGEAVEAAASSVELNAVARLRSLAATMARVGRTEHERDLIEVFHRPENRAVHDRMSEHIIERLGPVLEVIVADGIADGSFRSQDPRHAAAFILGSFSRIHDVVEGAEQAAAVLAELDVFVLRGLGYEAELES